MAAAAPQSKRNTYLQNIRNIFIFRRRPKILFPKEWERPEEDEYWQQMYYEGFISAKHWPQDQLESFPLIIQDVRDLDEHLMPVFWRYNQLARYYQNRFYLYQWVFMFGTFLTTIFAVLTSYIGTSSTDVGLLLRFSIATTIISAITSYFTLLQNQSDPRKRWANYRRLTEELRMLYFKFLARLEPFDKPDRVNRMRERVMEIRERERENV